jgi:serine/threonine protein kinase/tetratricopeptide (TPR) repeat protein
MTRPSTLPPLTVELWARVRDAFSELSELAPSERTTPIQQLERTDPAAARHVIAMLRAAERPSPLDKSIGAIAEELLAPDSVPVPQTQFGPYRLMRPLGRGGMGVVYLAHRDDLGTSAAIKILPHAWLDPSRREQFIEEMRILATLSHESIAGLLHAGQLDDGTPWFAMQYVEGEPITKWVWRHELTADAILQLFDRLCAAVQHAHGHPVIHRDLKPSNVLVTGDGTVKLLDFGIAKRLRSQGADEQSRTITREVTLEYAAPEQLLGKVAGVRADVYALGIMLYELLVGRRPYEVADLTPAATELAIRSAYPPSIDRAVGPRTLRADERRDLDALISRATAPDVADRYVSVEEMRRDIRSFLDRKPLMARKAGWSYQTRKLVRRRWRELATAAVLTIAAIVGVVLHNRELAASRDVAVAEAARTNRLRQYMEDLFQGGPQPTGPLDSIRVMTLVENGIRGARALTTDPAIQVELLGMFGTMSRGMGDLARADSLFLLATDRATALYGPNHPETLRARVRRAQLLDQVGKTDSAERELRAIEQLARKYAPTHHPVVAEVDGALGSLLGTRYQFPAAIAYLERALAEQGERDTTSREYAEALRDLGNVVAIAGNLDRADSLFLRSLPLVRQLFGPRHPDVAYLLANLGNTASQRGRLAEAERYQREAVAINAAWYGEGNFYTAMLNGVLAQTLIRLKRYDDAIPILHQTIDVFSRSPDLGPDAAPTNIARSTLAKALAGRGDHQEAVREYELALAGLRRSTGEKGLSTLAVATSLAEEVLYAGHVDSAVTMLRKELAIAVAAYGEAHPTVADIRVKLGGALVAKREFAEAITVTTTALKVLDARAGTHAAGARLGRRNLLAAYVATGDSANAARVRAELADTVTTVPKK